MPLSSVLRTNDVSYSQAREAGDDESDTSPCINGLGRQYFAYGHTSNLKLYLKSFSAIQYNMAMPSTMATRDRDIFSCYTLLGKFEMMDLHRRFVRVVNTSSKVTAVNVLCSIRQLQYSGNRKEGIKDALSAFASLRNDMNVQLVLHDRTSGAPMQTPVYEEQLAELHLLQRSPRHEEDQPALLDEWIFFRRWMQKEMSGAMTAPWLTFYLVPWLSEAWRAHAAGDRKAFEEAEQGLKGVWRRVQRGVRLKTRALIREEESVVSKPNVASPSRRQPPLMVGATVKLLPTLAVSKHT